MIVELFGPPGVGKTTLTRALAARLAAEGLPVALLLSYRPAEQGRDRVGEAAGAGSGASPAATLRRLGRPAIELLGAACRQLGAQSGRGKVGDLLALLPPRDLLWAIRLRQYLVRLERAWHHAARSSAVVLCDQGFLQAVASLVVLAAEEAGGVLPRALDILPPADILVHLDAPIEVLTERLARRRRDQGRFERLLELDLAANLAFVPAIARLDAALVARGRPPLHVGCGGQAEMEEGADRVAALISAAWCARRATAA
jgi:thymidylate kinase